MLVEAGRLAAEGTSFALATVVGVERPSSARVGDRALVTADGELHGWVGGACTEPEVARLALQALADGDVRRERIASRCASEGAVEVLIEPQVPAPLLAVIGDAGTRVPAVRLRGETSVTLGMALLLVLLHDGPRRNLFGAPAIPPGLLGRLLDVLILPLLLVADAPHVLSLWHGDSLLEICKRQSPCQRPGSDPPRVPFLLTG